VLAEPQGPAGGAIVECARTLQGRDISALFDLDNEPASDPVSLMSFADRSLASLSPRARDAAVPTPPIVAALGYLSASITGRPRLAEAARAAHLSPSRLTHRFSEEVGIPFRRFVLWLRLRRAGEEMANARTLTEAAIAAGFSDLSHLGRVCRATFGVTPSAVADMNIVPQLWPV
jgi:AraC-like DNA-binding protein